MNFIKKILLWIIASAVAIYITAEYLPQYLNIEWWIKAFFLSWLIFWILNTFFKPILKLISLPFIIITAWLFIIVINSIVIFSLSYFFNAMPTLNVIFEIKWGILSYLIVWFVLSVINYLTHWIIKIK